MSNILQTFKKINPLGHIPRNIVYLNIPSLGFVTQDMHISYRRSRKQTLFINGRRVEIGRS